MHQLQERQHRVVAQVAFLDAGLMVGEQFGVRTG
jgi:hypothetical protein